MLETEKGGKRFCNTDIKERTCLILENGSTFLYQKSKVHKEYDMKP